MTVVAVRKYSERIEIAADSIIVTGSRIISNGTQENAKLFSQNGLIIGGTGSCSENTMIQLFTRNHKPTTANVEAVLDFFLEFEDWVRKRDNNFKSENHYLIVFDSKIFRTYGGLNIFEVPEFDAIGAGEDFALAALHLGKSPAEAVTVACELSVWCNLPVNTEMAYIEQPSLLS